MAVVTSQQTVIGACAAAAALTLAIFSTDSPQAGLGVFALAVLCLGVVAKPLPFIGVFLCAWGSTLFLTQDLAFGTIGTVELRLSRIVGGAFTIACILRLGLRLVSRDPLPALPIPLRWYGMFVLFLAIPLAMSSDLVVGFNDLIRFACGSALMFLVWAEVKSEHDFKLIHRALLIGTYLGALVTVFHWVEGTEELSLVSKGMRFVRTSGGLGQANVSALLAVCGFAILTAYVYRARTPRGRLIWLLSSAPYFMAIAVTVSRTAMIEIVVFTVLLVFFDRQVVPKVSHKTVLMGGSILFLATALYIKGFDQVAHRLEDVPVFGEAQVMHDKTGSGRIMIWRGYIRGFLDGGAGKMLVGHGVGSSLGEISTYIGVSLGAHNEYLHVLFEFGIVGLVLYMGFVIALIRMCIRTHQGRDQISVTPDTRSFVSVFLWFFLAYSVSEEFFGWGMNQLGTRIYVLTLVGLTLAAIRIGSIPPPKPIEHAGSGTMGDLDPHDTRARVLAE
jgi:O-antigen ligase